MTGPSLSLLLGAGVCLALAPNLAAQTWTPTSMPNTNWSSIAASADGSRWVASAGRIRPHPSWGGNDASPIWISTNGGADWAITGVPFLPWQSVASSADGMKLVALSAWGFSSPNSSIYTSTNGGVTWTSNAVANVSYWNSVASSADGVKLVAAASGLGIYTSTNGGANWQSRPVTLTNQTAVACSADGARLVAADAADFVHPTGGIYLSTNSGASWSMSPAPMAVWLSVASSADGRRLIAAAHSTNALQPGMVFLSTNAGLSWDACALPPEYWQAVASSADGRTLVAGAVGAGFISTDYGATWASTGAPDIFWVAFASSADGAKLVGATDQNVYTAQLPPQPSLALTPLGHNLQLSWILPSTNLVLQVRADLHAGAWTDSPLLRTLDLTHLQYHATVAPTNSQEFFRLLSR